MLNGKSVLVTGGTGSFGKQFVKTVLTNYPEVKRIVVFSRDELKQFEMYEALKQYDDQLRFFIGDVRDRERLIRAFNGVDYVVHAAAMKQVPACEYNPFEAVKTNILGAQNVINCAIDSGVKKVVALSTDKACAPVNLYGATKLCSDKLFLAANTFFAGSPTNFSVVRYGNVAGSRGSVIPYFRSLINSGVTELPITDFRMTRFWLSLQQAVDMVLLALKNMQGAEIFVKKIPSMFVTNLAKAMAPNLKTVEIGIRAGEKIHEQMICREDAHNTLDMGDYFLISQDERRLAEITGKKVPADFEYRSNTNDKWLSVEDIEKLLKNENL